jgi:hypothetical protein
LRFRQRSRGDGLASDERLRHLRSLAREIPLAAPLIHSLREWHIPGGNTRALWPPSAPLTGPFADEYTLGSTEIVKQVDGDTTYYFIPTTELPLLDPLRSLGVPEPVLNIFQPALQVIVEAGYDRSIPFGDPTPAELIPTIDPSTFTLEFANGVAQGANNAFELHQLSYPRIRPEVGTPVPAVTSTCSTSGTGLTDVPRSCRTPSAMPFMPWM